MVRPRLVEEGKPLVFDSDDDDDVDYDVVGTSHSTSNTSSAGTAAFAPGWDGGGDAALNDHSMSEDHDDYSHIHNHHHQQQQQQHIHPYNHYHHKGNSNGYPHYQHHQPHAQHHSHPSPYDNAADVSSKSTTVTGASLSPSPPCSSSSSLIQALGGTHYVTKNLNTKRSFRTVIGGEVEKDKNRDWYASSVNHDDTNDDDDFDVVMQPTTTTTTTGSRSSPKKKCYPSRRPTRFEIGAPHKNNYNDDDDGMYMMHDDDHCHHEDYYDLRPTERMQGIEDHSLKTPLVVVDGANVAYHYGAALHPVLSPEGVSGSTTQSRPLPDVRGILVACQYFQQHGLRVLVVLHGSWFRNASQQQHYHHYHHFYIVDPEQHQQQQMQVLQQLQQQGLVVIAPPTDDDDAYCLTIARREHARAAAKNFCNHGPAYVLSNDLFRDACQREKSSSSSSSSSSSDLQTWLTKGSTAAITTTNNTTTSSSLAQAATNSNNNNHSSSSSSSSLFSFGPGRLSYTFADVGKMDEYGERELDFLPNPRHPLIVWTEQQELLKQQQQQNHHHQY